eukprot:GHVT01087839.1.p1 GENE.GHVT01087839.1~~GHVT01087839.1.p1  ORF type:complete len:315 (+),score=24.54 GHVT01087839.1:451-1395(+)
MWGQSGSYPVKQWGPANGVQALAPVTNSDRPQNSRAFAPPKLNPQTSSNLNRDDYRSRANRSLPTAHWTLGQVLEARKQKPRRSGPSGDSTSREPPIQPQVEKGHVAHASTGTSSCLPVGGLNRKGHAALLREIRGPHYTSSNSFFAAGSSRGEVGRRLLGEGLRSESDGIDLRRFAWKGQRLASRHKPSKVKQIMTEERRAREYQNEVTREADPKRSDTFDGESAEDLGNSEAVDRSIGDSRHAKNPVAVSSLQPSLVCTDALSGRLADDPEIRRWQHAVEQKQLFVGSYVDHVRPASSADLVFPFTTIVPCS